jgi:hypothetical protein
VGAGQHSWGDRCVEWDEITRLRWRLDGDSSVGSVL